MKFIPVLLPLLALPLLAQEKEVPPPFEKNPPSAVEAEGDSDDSSGTDPFDPDAYDGTTPALVQVQVEFIEMSHEQLTDLLFLKRPTKADATELRKQIQTMVKSGDVKLLDTQILTGRSGEKCVIESIHEQIFPTEYYLPELEKAVPPSDKKDKPEPARTELIAPAGSEPIPTSFETRNLGSTLEIEPTIGPEGKIIDLRFAPELSWYDGNTSWYERKDALGNVMKVEMPDFYTLRMSTALTVTNGSYVLAGVASPKAKDGSTDLTRKVMVFIKADVLPVR